MDLPNRNKSVAQLRKENGLLIYGILAVAVAVLLLAIKVFFMTEIVVREVPGMPNGAKIEKNGMDVGAERAYAYAVTTALASINPSNGESVKAFVQPFLSPDCFTKVSKAIDDKVATLKAEHELGSYYFVTRGFVSDDKLGRVFVLGDLHTVNAAKDTAEPYVFEYPVHFANYQMTFDDAASYPGDRVHNTQWIQAQKK
jgi:hypothetical protein